MTVWSARSLQAVWFTPGQTTQIPVERIFQTVAGNAPNSTQSLAGGFQIATGVNGQSICHVQLQPGRIDFFETPQSQAGSLFPLFPGLNAAMAKFRQRLILGSGVAGDVVRLALVVNISQQTPTAEAATNLILTKLGLALPFPDASELVFQINRRTRLTSAANSEMNRLLKWLVESFQQINVAAGSPSVQSFDLATLSVDVNLVPVGGRVFTPADQQPIFNELADEVERLCNANAVNALL